MHTMKKLLLISIVVLLLSTLLFTSCNEAEDTESTSTTATETSSAVESSGATPNTTTEPEVKKPAIIEYEELTVPSDGYILKASDSYITGTLLNISESHPYQYNLPTLQPSHKIKDSTLKIAGQNLMILFGNTSQNYLLKSSKLFYKTDAFPYLDAMMTQFAKDSGRNTAQIVNAYLYSDPSTLVNEYVAGYSIAMNMFENGATYSLTAAEFSFEYNGKTITCLDWFIENCPKYGFIYTGLTGSQQQTLATFRFVGRPHAIAMSQYDIIDMSIYISTIRLAEKLIAITDKATGQVWYIFYQQAHETNENTVLTIPAGATYTVSGDNVGGFIVAYTMPVQ